MRNQNIDFNLTLNSKNQQVHYEDDPERFNEGTTSNIVISVDINGKDGLTPNRPARILGRRLFKISI